MAREPQPAGASVRSTRPPLVVFNICLAAALASAWFVLGILTIAAAAVLVVVALVLQARGRNPATWFAAGTGVAAGCLIYLLIVLVTGQ